MICCVGVLISNLIKKGLHCPKETSNSYYLLNTFSKMCIDKINICLCCKLRGIKGYVKI
jgi:hypothetical protein